MDGPLDSFLYNMLMIFFHSGPRTTATNGRIEVVALQIATNWLQTDPSQEIGIQPQLE